jgi:hypothetical protein
MARFLALSGALVVTALISYSFGREELESGVRSFQEEIHQMELREDALQQENANLRVVAEKAKLTVAQVERRYEQDVPKGDRRDLLDLVTGRLEAGVAPDRLAFLIESASKPVSCEPVETKRFLLRTPLYNGANTSVSFANEAVLVTGMGASAKTADGLPQAWYDPAQPIDLILRRIDGTEVEVTGVLPIQKSIEHGGAEHRFLIRPGARGFVQVSAERCAYP